MPTVRVFTNVSKNDLPEQFGGKFLSELATSLKRDEECDQLMFSGPTSDPMCYVEIISARGPGDIEEIRQKVIGISDFLKGALKITDGEMIQIHFHAIPSQHVGFGTGKILIDFDK